MKLFITAPSTNIGKTLVTCILCHQLKLSAIKPVISGWNDQDSDTIQILRAQSLPASEKNINSTSPWRYNAPLSVDMAAKLEGKILDFNEIVQFCNDSLANIIEGVGGIMSPIDETHTNLDLIKATSSEIILVTGTYLGSISHTLTALEVIKYNNLHLKHIIISESLTDNVGLNETYNSIKNFTKADIKLLPLIYAKTHKWLHAPVII